MLLKTYDCTKKFIKDHQAVVHVDGTARPQIISKNDNKSYYNILKAYCKKSGDLALINTSFNVRGEPIVCSIKDAYNCFLNTNLDIFVCENFFITKHGGIK